MKHETWGYLSVLAIMCAGFKFADAIVVLILGPKNWGDLLRGGFMWAAIAGFAIWREHKGLKIEAARRQSGSVHS